ncbi:hypothetical protein LCGC14_2397730, partial [marine sediment metagenome]
GNVTRGDFRVLGRGLGSAVIIEYGGFEQRRVAEAGEHEIDWKFNLDVFIRVQDELGGVDEAAILRQLLLDEFNVRPKLGTSIIFDALIETGEPAPEDVKMGGVRYVFEILRLTATEEFSVSYAE